MSCADPAIKNVAHIVIHSPLMAITEERRMNVSAKDTQIQPVLNTFHTSQKRLFRKSIGTRKRPVFIC